MCSLEMSNERGWKSANEIYEQAKKLLGENVFPFADLESIFKMDESIGAFVRKQTGSTKNIENAEIKYRLRPFFQTI